MSTALIRAFNHMASMVYSGKIRFNKEKKDWESDDERAYSEFIRRKLNFYAANNQEEDI